MRDDVLSILSSLIATSGYLILGMVPIVISLCNSMRRGTMPVWLSGITRGYYTCVSGCMYRKGVGYD